MVEEENTRVLLKELGKNVEAVGRKIASTKVSIQDLTILQETLEIHIATIEKAKNFLKGD